MFDYWRRRTWKSGDIPDYKLETLRKLPNDVLARMAAGRKPGSVDRIRAEWVLLERQNEWAGFRSWASLVISLISLVVAGYAALR